ncbi:substrate-binding domain-containing protein [Bradyrhizobium prioriisuperbiae]|uniref:substrate-binding domain-containing protein n=1 Tax=Bradyrhizobium prioriisuperbiae TaxID=2854389 RepID=UPI0028EA7AF1|nr:substrate-binding domain-containing protein [Bradyrhizobium prioritasuperba]
MKLQSSTKHLLGTASVLAMLASAVATPANAAATKGIYFGGSTLASEAFRAIFDCYMGATVGATGWTDGFQFGVTPLPATCTNSTSNTVITLGVQGMYAGVGSGNGVRGYIANDPKQWYGGSITPSQTFTLTNSASTTVQPPFPAVQPPFADTLNTTFGAYPYPRVDAGLSDSPLPATLAAMTTTSITFNTVTWTPPATVTASGSSVVSYTTTVTYGTPIQIPAFAVNVAIPVNTAGLTVNSAIAQGTINPTSPPWDQNNQGAAIQLSEAQLCAIFSGKVTNWNSTANIPFIDSTGAASTRPFYYTNVGNGIGTAAQYTTASLPITVVYRSDGSGTSFILTNYLKAVCPQIDASYATIFGATNLPSTNFSALIANIANAGITGSWVGVSGSGNVQSAVGVTSTQGGRIGYLSSDFVKPYAIAAQAPSAAAVQNEQQRAAGVELPITTATTSPTFIAATPAAAELAWQDGRLQAPNASSTWNDYNVYGYVFPSGTPIQGGVTVDGKSVLPLTNVAGAYPLGGTAFLDLYSCYSVAADSARVTNLKTFLSWYFQDAANNALATQIIQASGFQPLKDTIKAVIRTKYLGTVNATRINGAPPSGPGGSTAGGCNGVTGGAGAL